MTYNSMKYIKYDNKIIYNVEYELNEMLHNVNHFSPNQIKMTLQNILSILRDNKLES